MSARFFLPYQRAWIEDASPLKIMEKSRQIGITFADAYDSVAKAGARGARLDVWVSSRDELQARLYLEDCLRWAKILDLAAREFGERALAEEAPARAHVLEFDSGRRIYSLSSNPNALAGKRGHVKLDEFALHQDQRLLYQVAKPVTTWGGQLCLISTHRGAHTLFNQLLVEARAGGNPMGWSVHRVPLQTAVAQGLAERIRRKTGATGTDEEFVRGLRAGCVDEEQWRQEYCCDPADESAAFLSHELLASRAAPGCLKDLTYLAGAAHPLYLGLDVARQHDLCVLDVGEKIGETVWDRLRLEFLNQPYAEIERALHRLLGLRQLKRACLDATGLGGQLAERARACFPGKVEAIVFTPAVKEDLAVGFKIDLEQDRLRLAEDDRLRADLRGLRRETTASGHLRYAGECADSHCDRFWAKALRQHAARHRVRAGGRVA